MKFFRKLTILVGLIGLGAVASVCAQNTTEPSPESFSQRPVAKDARTRAKLHTELGSLYFQDGDLIVALEELTLAAAIDPTYAKAFATRGVVLYHVKEFDSADQDFRTALNLDEKDPEISNNYGWFLCRTGKPKEALGHFQRAIKNPLYRTPGLAYLNEGECYIKLGELDQAEESLRKGMRLVPGNLQGLYHQAVISYKRGNYDAARKYLSGVIRSERVPAEVLWLALRIERQLGDKAAESAIAARLRRSFPESPEYQAFLKGNFE
ncbi:type IV pilus biogenesis/stability protein PilW [Propionivibrio limicola]|uniref:type IV pilus biogenesis/stability protein PilW n=1 Tax=Propionivibrio limicola TaxID=167645 RepID=UPI001292554B|nr:type IV pilus biogenesis/stability protein PilW [Propionivibrio limicola]